MSNLKYSTAMHQTDAFSEVTGGEAWQSSWVAEAAVQDEAAECASGRDKEDMPATEESIPS